MFLPMNGRDDQVHRLHRKNAGDRIVPTDHQDLTNAMLQAYWLWNTDSESG